MSLPVGQFNKIERKIENVEGTLRALELQMKLKLNQLEQISEDDNPTVHPKEDYEKFANKRLITELYSDCIRLNDQIVELNLKRNYYLVKRSRMLREKDKLIKDKINPVIYQPIIEMLNDGDILAIEKWSEMKVGFCIFDSKSNSWSNTSSDFANTILYYKSCFVTIVEDNDGNIFGLCNKAIITSRAWFADPNCFVFSLNSNGRLPERMKFDLMQTNNGFRLYEEGSNFLFGSGAPNSSCAFAIGRSDNELSFWQELSFNYGNYKNVLNENPYTSNSNKRFKVKRFITIKLI